MDTIRFWTKRLLLVTIVGGSVALMIGAFSEDSPSEPDRPTRITVEHVRTGGIVKTETDEKLVYAGIRSPYEGEPMFDEARKRNAELVGGRELRLRFDREPRDKKNRVVAYAFCDEGMVNVLLVSEGLAYVRLAEGQQRFAETLLAAQNKARKARKGMWAAPTPSPEDLYPADPKYGNFHRPLCDESAKIKSERKIDFQNRDMALEKGYAPCDKCQP